MSSEMLPCRWGSALEASLINKLRPYQREVALAILDSVFGRKGITFSVEIARQGGKNELSAQLELLLLTLFMTVKPQNLIKCAPTFKPQTVISIARLKDRLIDAGFAGTWISEMGYIITEPCVGVCDTSCVDVCPVDCIYPAEGYKLQDCCEHIYGNSHGQNRASKVRLFYSLMLSCWRWDRCLYACCQIWSVWLYGRNRIKVSLPIV